MVDLQDAEELRPEEQQPRDGCEGLKPCMVAKAAERIAAAATTPPKAAAVSPAEAPTLPCHHLPSVLLPAPVAAATSHARIIRPFAFEFAASYAARPSPARPEAAL